VRLYLLHGTVDRVSQDTGIPIPSIMNWKNRDRAWWDRTCAELIVEIEGNYRPGWVRVLGKAIEVMEKRLEEGDPKVAKDGKVVMQGVPAKEAAVIAGIAADKLKQFANVPGKPESREERRERLKAVAGEPASVSVLKTG
jgi:hypothetical protein